MPRSVLLISALLILPSAAHAQQAPPSPTPTDPPPAVALSPTPQPHTTRNLFGQPDTDWLTISLGAQHDFNESSDFNLNFAWSRFIVRDVEFGAEGSAWYFDQERDPAVGFGAELFLRWHFLSRPSWSLFTDAGLGMLLSSDDVPNRGTSLNFTPRAGFGATFRITGDGTRLEVGLRWSHISNARLTGDTANPGRDAPQLYFGIIIPF